MPINVNRFPLPFNAVGNPIPMEIESNRAAQIAGLEQIWSVNVVTNPPDGATLTVDGFAYTFRTTADAYDVGDIQIGGTEDITADNIRDAVTRNSNFPSLTAVKTAGPIVAILGTKTSGAFTVVSSTANVTAVEAQPYLAPAFREGYRLVVEVFVEKHWHYDDVQESAGSVYVPTVNPQFGVYENLVFDLQSLLAPYSKFDIVSPNLQVAQFLARCVRRFCLRWTENYAINQDAGLWFYDLASTPSDPLLSPYVLPARFLNQTLYRSLAAVFGQWESQRKLPEVPGGCLDTQPDVPYLLSAWFEGLSRYPLNAGLRKRTAPGLVEYLTFWTGEFNDPEEFTVHILPEVNGVFGPNIAPDNWFQLWAPNDCTGTGAGWANQLVTIPLHRLWDLPAWQAIQNDATSFCAFVSGPQGYEVEATELTPGLLWADAEAVVGSVFTPPASVYTNASVVAAPTFDAPNALRLRIERSFLSPSVNYVAARWLTVPAGTFQDNKRYRITFKVYVQSGQPALFTGSGTIYISLASSSFYTPVEQTVWTYGVDGYGVWLDLSLTIDTTVGADAGITQLYVFVGNTLTTIPVQTEVRDIFLDQLRISLLLSGETTVPRNYTLNHCGDTVSFQYQNRLGVPDTFHVFRAPDYSIDTERLLAGAVLDGANLSTLNDQADYQYRSETALVIKGGTGMLEDWEAAGLQEWATSNNVYLLVKRCPNTNGCGGVPSFGPIPPLEEPGEQGLIRLTINDVPEGESFAFTFPEYQGCEEFLPPYPFERLVGESMDDFIDIGVVGLINFFGTNFAVRDGNEVLVYLNLAYYEENFGANICGQSVSLCMTEGIPVDGVTVTSDVECVPFNGGECFWQSVPVVVKTSKFDLQQGTDGIENVEYEVIESRRFIVNTQ